MIWNLQFEWFLLAFASVGILSFLFGLALDGIMNEDGFGAILNAIIITVSFFATVWICNLAGVSLRHLEVAVPYGMAGAFTAFAFLALLKAALKRLI